MPPFRRVADQRAGATALGILVPLGTRPAVIVRPRGLPFDLLPLKPDPDREQQPRFCNFNRDGAAQLARQFLQALEYAVLAQTELLGVGPHPSGQGFCVGLEAVGFTWLACRRQPGQPYQPAQFDQEADAVALAQQLAGLLQPAPDAEQEYYFNTQHFHT